MRSKPRLIVRVQGSRRTRMRRNSGQHGCRRRRQASQRKAGLQPVYRPAELCLNGECTDANGYYIEQNDPAALSTCPCLDNRIPSDRAGRALSKQTDHAHRANTPSASKGRRSMSGAICMSSISASRARSEKWPPALRNRNCSRCCRKAASAMRSASIGTDGCSSPTTRSTIFFWSGPTARTSKPISIPTTSISRTI